MAAVVALNYHPSRSARSLAGSRSFLLSVVTDEKLTLDHWHSGTRRGLPGAYSARSDDHLP